MKQTRRRIKQIKAKILKKARRRIKQIKAKIPKKVRKRNKRKIPAGLQNRKRIRYRPKKLLMEMQRKQRKIHRTRKHR